MKRHNPRTHDDFDDGDWLDSDFDVDGFIATMEREEKQRRRRSRSGRSWQEKRREERWLRAETSDWDSYDEDYRS